MDLVAETAAKNTATHLGVMLSISPGTMHFFPISIVGPTAVGKSDVALALAERVGGEIISVDSMQVYRGMVIGTAKPTAEQQRRIRHHLIDIADVNESFDAARFVVLAQEAVCEIQGRGKVPIFCGGSGLYFKAYSDGLGVAPPSNPQLRAQLEGLPLAQLLEELKMRDPVTFEKIDRCNLRRVVRALEVIRLTGNPFSAQRAAWPSGESTPSPWFAVGLRRAPEDLKARINRRVEQMFADGLVGETRVLLEQGLAENRTAMQALGYRQAVEHLLGKRALDETIDLVKIRTRQFAKRQLTWFRRQMALEWIDANSSPEALVQQILDKYHNCSGLEEKLANCSGQEEKLASR